MVAVLAPFLTGALSAAGGAAANGLLGSLFGGGSAAPDPTEMMKEMLDYQMELALKNAQLIKDSAEESSAQSEKEIQDLKKDYSDKRTAEEFRTSFKGKGAGSYRQLIDMAANFNQDPTALWEEKMADATAAGLTPTSTVRVPGAGKVSLLRAGRDFIDHFNSQAPELWNEALDKFYTQKLGRHPTKEEQDKYNYRDFKTMDQVAEALATTTEYRNRNIWEVDPQEAATRTYLSGFAAPIGPGTPGWSAHPPGSGSKSSKNSTLNRSVSAKGMDTRRPRPRGFEDTNGVTSSDYTNS